MEKKSIPFQIKGMRQDISISKADPSYAYEIINMRITPMHEGTMLSLVNEKGNATMPLSDQIQGSYVGHCVINQYLVLFTTNGETQDYIYRIDFSKLVEGEYEVSLRFVMDAHSRIALNPDHYIETIGDYETDSIIKVYWTDGATQPKVINILKDYNRGTNPSPEYNPNDLNFIPNLKLGETISIVKNDDAGGMFSAGVIQYCFTYFNKHGQESNIVTTSPLQYIANGNSGNAPDKTVGVSFTVTLNALDQDFENIRLYSIRRTSINGTPIVKRVADLSVPKGNGATLIYTDNNTAGEEIDPTIMFYLGGEEVVANTMEAKDTVLFLGNISMLRESPKNTDGSTILNNSSSPFWGLNVNLNGSKTINIPVDNTSVTNVSYSYSSQLNEGSQDITVFKTREHYRLGLQFQHKTGVWSDVYWINDKQITTPPSSDASSTVFHLPSLTYSDQSVITALRNQGYIKVRPMVVYPTFSDREVICQGMVCPTVYNIEERYGGVGPYARASWFARPTAPSLASLSSTEDYSTGAWVEFRHNYHLRDASTLGAEIQSMDAGSAAGDTLHSYGTGGFFLDSTTALPEDKFTDYYFVDQSIVTLHSPESVFDESMIISDNNHYGFRVVGAIPLVNTVSDIDIQATAPYCGLTKTIVTSTTTDGVTYYGSTETTKLGFEQKKFSLSGTNGWRYAPTYQYWIDTKRRWAATLSGNDNDVWENITAGVIIYPWHKTGQFLTTFPKIGVKEEAVAKMVNDYSASLLQEKKYSHMKYSNNSYFMSTAWEPKIGTDPANYSVYSFNSDQDTYLNFRTSDYQLAKYAGNMDGIIVPGTDKSGKFDLYTTVPNRDFEHEGLNPANIYSPYLVLANHESFITDSSRSTVVFGENENIFTYKNINGAGIVSSKESKIPTGTTFGSSDPIKIKYKSTPHLLISMKPVSQTNNNDPNRRIMPTFNSMGYPSAESNYLTESALTTSRPSGMSDAVGYLLLGEVYKEYNNSTAFGGITQEAFINNNWLVGGDSVSLDGSSFTLTWNRGDTYYQRYDCLKTYPFTLEDENSIVEVVSFMCETRVNIDGRYDKNRGKASLVAHPSNFNLLNKAYSQIDNFYTYHGINSNLNETEKFPNLITWSLSKNQGATTDAWTNVNMAATLLLDGDRGSIQRIEKYRNDLFAFQDNGVAKIQYNDRTVLSTISGAPVELANSSKVEGKAYYTELEGLTNRESIKVTPNGIYFVDGKTKTAYLFNGQQCEPLSDTKGMKTFFDGQPDNFRIFYDSKEKDVYFVNSSKCLCFSEKLGEFVGFFSYENVPLICNVGDKLISFNNNYNIWQQYAGNYNSFYNVIKPHSITFTGNDGVPGDKIFTNLDWMSDSFLDDNFVTTKTFDRLKAWNEYQVGEISLVNTKGMPSNLKKKFRIWRANMPRANWNGRDRIRNPWCYVQLRMDNPSRYKTVLHHIFLDYYM